MALVYRAELHPTKLELLADWLPTRTWYRGPGTSDLKRVVSYRFDDPAGAVGIETLVVRDGGGPLWQTPLTYRDAPLDGRDQWLVGTADHSVLGQRWIYDACGDPVYARVLASTMLTGAGQADVFVEIDGRSVRLEPAMSVVGSGTDATDVPTVTAVVRVDDDNDPTLILTDTVELAVARILADPSGHLGGTDPDVRYTLTGTWSGQSVPLVLAYARGV